MLTVYHSRDGMKIAILIFCSLLLVPCFAPAQEIHENVDIQLVNVYLAAMDAKGRFVTDLKSNELQLKEDGIPQSIATFANFAQDPSNKLGEENVPLTVGLVIDTSQSMAQAVSGEQQKIDIVKNAAFRIIDELRPDDHIVLVSFNDTPTEDSPLTTDFKQMRQDLLFEDVKSGSTALYDAVYFALQKIKDESGRKLIVVCSDGEDTSSVLRFDEVVNNLIASDVTVLAFGTMALSSTSLRGHYALQKLAEASGGYAFFPTSLKELDAVMDRLREGMRSQYSLAYRPTRSAADGTWRKIEITTSRPGLKLRYREGYQMTGFASRAAKK